MYKGDGPIFFAHEADPLIVHGDLLRKRQNLRQKLSSKSHAAADVRIVHKIE
jgi:hypothetical protein